MIEMQLDDRYLDKIVISYFGDCLGHICDINFEEQKLKIQMNGDQTKSGKSKWIDVFRIKSFEHNVIRLHPTLDEYLKQPSVLLSLWDKRCLSK